MDAVTLATVDAHGKTTREINEELQRARSPPASARSRCCNPGSRHNLAVGILEPARIVFRGDVGYFCGGLSDGLDIEVDGDAGWSLGADMMSGKIVVHGSSGSSTAPVDPRRPRRRQGRRRRAQRRSRSRAAPSSSAARPAT